MPTISQLGLKFHQRVSPNPTKLHRRFQIAPNIQQHTTTYNKIPQHTQQYHNMPHNSNNDTRA